jgi:hypothetical protein
MIEAHRRDRRQQRPVDHIGRIEPSAEPGLEQQDVGVRARKGEIGRGGRELEEGDRLALIRRLALVEQGQQRRIADLLARHHDALVEAHEMGRSVKMHRVSRCLQHRPQEGEDRALAVGPGDMEDGRQRALGMAERRE